MWFDWFPRSPGLIQGRCCRSDSVGCAEIRTAVEGIDDAIRVSSSAAAASAASIPLSFVSGLQRRASSITQNGTAQHWSWILDSSSPSSSLLLPLEPNELSLILLPYSSSSSSSPFSTASSSASVGETITCDIQLSSALSDLSHQRDFHLLCMPSPAGPLSISLLPAAAPVEASSSSTRDPAPSSVPPVDLTIVPRPIPTPTRSPAAAAAQEDSNAATDDSFISLLQVDSWPASPDAIVPATFAISEEDSQDFSRPWKIEWAKPDSEKTGDENFADALNLVSGDENIREKSAAAETAGSSAKADRRKMMTDRVKIESAVKGGGMTVESIASFIQKQTGVRTPEQILLQLSSETSVSSSFSASQSPSAASFSDSSASNSFAPSFPFQFPHADSLLEADKKKPKSLYGLHCFSVLLFSPFLRSLSCQSISLWVFCSFCSHFRSQSHSFRFLFPLIIVC